MRTPERSLPSFSFVLSQECQYSTLPEPDRTTCRHNYHPVSPLSGSAQNALMKTIDLRASESHEFSSSFILPDIFEGDDIEFYLDEGFTGQSSSPLTKMQIFASMLRTLSNMIRKGKDRKI